MSRLEIVWQYLYRGFIILFFFYFSAIFLYEGFKPGANLNARHFGPIIGIGAFIFSVFSIYRLFTGNHLTTMRGTNIIGNRQRSRKILKEMGWKIRYDSKQYMLAWKDSLWFPEGRQFSIIFDQDWIHLNCITFSKEEGPHPFSLFKDKNSKKDFITRWHEVFHSPSHQTLSA